MTNNFIHLIVLYILLGKVVPVLGIVVVQPCRDKVLLVRTLTFYTVQMYYTVATSVKNSYMGSQWSFPRFSFVQ